MIGYSDQRYVYGHKEFPRCEASGCDEQAPYEYDGDALCQTHLVEKLAADPKELASAICDILDVLRRHRLE